MVESNERSEESQWPECSRSLEGLVVAGSYRISGLLGSGGMGDVYHAEHVRLGSSVAVKFMRAGARDGLLSIERFRREARRIAALKSEHVVKVFDYGELPDHKPYLVMERLIGEDMRSLLEREGPLPIRRAVKLLMDACRGLSVVHAAGLVHRDLKPANLFVEKTATGIETCKILDFGVVKASASEATHPGAVLGTIRYMAPEQLEDSSRAKASADVYALGAILYECLCGVPAIAGETLQDTMFAILHREPRRPSDLRAMPSELESVVLCALSKDSTARYASAEALEHALAPFGSVVREPKLMEAVDEITLNDALEPRDERQRGSQGRATGRALLVLLVAIGFGGAAGWLARGAARPEGTRAVQQTSVTERAIPLQQLSPASAGTSLAGARPTAAPVQELAVSAPSSAQPPRPPANGRVSASIRDPERPPAYAPRPVEPTTPVAGRFDPSDPYE